MAAAEAIMYAVFIFTAITLNAIMVLGCCGLWYFMIKGLINVAKGREFFED